MEDKIQPYRQPIVTVAGILLGFTLNVASVWGSKAFSISRLKEMVIAIGLFTCIPLLLIVLYRALNMNYPREKAETYYKTTLLLFIIGIGIIFLSIVITLVESFILHRL